MKITDIAIYASGIDQPYRQLSEVTAKVSKASLFSKSPTIEDANFKLQEEASKLGANAVIYVTYSRGMTLMSYEVLTARGIAVIAELDEIACPYCAETIKRAAKKCKHCGEVLAPPTPVAASQTHFSLAPSNLTKPDVPASERTLSGTEVK